MKTIAYLGISTDKQDTDIQKLAVLEYARNEALIIDKFVSVEISSRKQKQYQDLNIMVEHLADGDVLLVSELSKIGRSLSQIISIVDGLIKKGIGFVAIKENIKIDGEQNVQNKMMVRLFSVFTEIERDLMSQRTKEGIAKAKANGKKLGRPRGSKSKSKLDGKEQTITDYLDKKISKASIARLLNVSPTTLNSFIKTRHLEAGSLLKRTL